MILLVGEGMLLHAKCVVSQGWVLRGANVQFGRSSLEECYPGNIQPEGSRGGRCDAKHYSKRVCNTRVAAGYPAARYSKARTCMSCFPFHLYIIFNMSLRCTLDLCPPSLKCFT